MFIRRWDLSELDGAKAAHGDFNGSSEDSASLVVLVVSQSSASVAKDWNDHMGLLVLLMAVRMEDEGGATMALG